MEHYFTNNESTKSEIREIKFSYEDKDFIFVSDNGVFSKNKLDIGSLSLIDSYLKENRESKEILDLGCGYGTIGIIISKMTGSFVDCTDVNRRSVHLTEMNVKKNKVNVMAFYSDAYQNVTKKYDVIITNPPIRAGKEKVLEFLLGAKDHLNKVGELWFVIRKDQGSKSIAKNLESLYKIENIGKNKGFYIYKAQIR
jgi:16S rRNA (guanine1207-N2)-methyltransferase